MTFAALLLPAWSQDQPSQKIQWLQPEVDQLQQQIKADKVAGNGQNAAIATADISGFTIRSKDGNFILHIGADVQIDNRTYFGLGSTGDIDTRHASSSTLI